MGRQPATGCQGPNRLVDSQGGGDSSENGRAGFCQRWGRGFPLERATRSGGRRRVAVPRMGGAEQLGKQMGVLSLRLRNVACQIRHVASTYISPPHLANGAGVSPCIRTIGSSPYIGKYASAQLPRAAWSGCQVARRGDRWSIGPIGLRMELGRRVRGCGAALGERTEVTPSWMLRGAMARGGSPAGPP